MPASNTSEALSIRPCARLPAGLPMYPTRVMQLAQTSRDIRFAADQRIQTRPGRITAAPSFALKPARICLASKLRDGGGR